MLDAIVNVIKKFREKIYNFFPHRQDAAMELVDSLASNTQARSVVELSLNPVHRRNYCSITRALGEFYVGYDAKDKQKQNQQLTQMLAEYCPPLQKRHYHLFALDCTSNPRLFSKTLADRGFVYAPNAVSGNKPVTIGHQYSMAVYLPEKLSQDTPPWVMPLSCERVETHQKGTMIGMRQMNTCISQSIFQDRLCVSVGDCAYSNPNCLAEAFKNPNQVHVSRARNNRTFYSSPVQKKRSKIRGRPKCYGKKFKLHAKRLRKPDECIEFKTFSKKGKEQIVRIECWNNMLMRGSRNADMAHCPFRLLKIQVYKPTGELFFKRPMWIIVSGKKRDQLSLLDVYNIYRQRFDIEHFFKFGKDKLLLDKLQTPEVEHEEAWWQFVMIAYAQLFMSRELAKNTPHPWEKYASEFKSPCNEKSPTQTQKSFGRIIQEIGTPAKPPRPRNKSRGRRQGDIQIKRQHHTVVIKRQKRENIVAMVT